MHDTYRIGYSDVVAALLCGYDNDCPHSVEASDMLAQEWLNVLDAWVDDRQRWSVA